MLSADGKTRLDGIKRKLPGVSDTMLVKSLKELEDDGLVRRHEYLEVPVRVEYEVTVSARALIPILTELAKWGSGLKNVCQKGCTPFAFYLSSFGLYVAGLLFLDFRCIIQRKRD